MKLDVFRHLWGFAAPGTLFPTWQQALPTVKHQRVPYAGVEFPILMVSDPGELTEALAQHALGFIPMAFTFGDSVAAHLASLRGQLVTAKQVPHRFVNCHAGRDAFSEQEAIAFFAGALALEDELGVKIAYETHRGRILYNPWTTARVLEKFDTLKLVCDYSHWVVVCERLIDDQLSILNACAERAVHIHARVGFENGPQVSDPAAPEWSAQLAAHERWWDAIWASQERRGVQVSTLTPEFGPPSYQAVLPYTQAPLADLARICDFMTERELARFAARAR
jgi:sugar phosphate isomerase/epimerase